MSEVVSGVVADAVREIEHIEADVTKTVATVEAKVEQAAKTAEAGLTDTEKLVIREAQLKLTQIEKDFQSLQQKAADLMQTIEKQAATAAQRLGKDVKEFVLDIETLTFKLRDEVEATAKAAAHRAFDTAEKIVKI